MARVSTIRIEQHIYDALAPFFVGKLSGTLYQSDCRPLDSKLEDAVITVSNASADQVQEGRARLNIFIPDIDNNSGRLVPNKTRLDELASLDEEIVSLLNEANTDYFFDLFQATATIAEPNTNEHFVNINLSFKRITF